MICEMRKTYTVIIFDKKIVKEKARNSNMVSIVYTMRINKCN